MLVGGDVKAYVAKVSATGSLLEHPDFLYHSVTIGDINVNSPSSYTVSLGSDPLLPPSPTSSTSTSILMQAVRSVILDPSSTFSSDLFLNLSPVILNQIPGNSVKEIVLDLTCSIAGTTPITYQLAQFQAEPLPAWVTLDVIASKLIINSPILSATTTFSVGVLATTPSSSYLKVVTLEVLKAETIACDVTN